MNIAYRFPYDMLTTAFQKAIVIEDQKILDVTGIYALGYAG